MAIETIRHQLRNNFVAIISLVIAIIALVYTTWREEATERHRNIRQAGFEMLKNLGELQITVNHSYYQPNNSLETPFLGWGHIALISDMSQILPEPIPETTQKLIHVWNEEWNKINSEEVAVTRISNEIDQTRKTVLDVIKNLK